MKKILLILILFYSNLAYSNGINVAIENDVFHHSDNNYSHATELQYIVANDMYGIRARMYTSEHISDTIPPTDEHAYCGTTSLIYKRNVKLSKGFAEQEIEIGVMGPLSYNREMQIAVHNMLGNNLPQGWDYQFPNEPIVNIYLQRYYPLMLIGKDNKLQIYSESVYGGSAGTTFNNLDIGLNLKLGYDIPKDKSENVILAKQARQFNNIFYYLLVETRGYYVLHNATLGNSFFRETELREEYEQELKPLVGELQYGLALGYSNFRLVYILAKRTKEYYGQHSLMDYGVLRLEFSF
jgi:hypothetical protein